MTTLVTGASGHVGVNLVRALLARNRKVRAFIHNNQQPLEGLDIELVHGDIRESLYKACDGVRVVYHLAACISIDGEEWDYLKSVNVRGTRNVVETCLRTGVKRIIHFSSIHALVQEPMDVTVDESRPLAESAKYPFYDRSKAAGEKEMLKGIERGLDTVIINPTAIIGPYDYQVSHFGQALIALADGTLPALVPGGFDWVDVRDVVDGALSAEDHAKSGNRYLLPGHWVSLKDMANLVTEITGVPAPRFICPMWLARLGAPLISLIDRTRNQRPMFTGTSLRALRSNHHISHEKAAGELGYTTRPFRDTISDTLRWFADNGKLRQSLPEVGVKE